MLPIYTTLNENALNDIKIHNPVAAQLAPEAAIFPRQSWRFVAVYLPGDPKLALRIVTV
jgi:hypothetical protein